MKRLSSLFLALILSFTLATQGWAALAFTVIDSGSDNVDRTAYTIPATGSLTPVSGTLYYLLLHNTNAAGNSQAPTASGTNGWNVVWTSESTFAWQLVSATNRSRTTVFSAVAGSNTAGTITVDYNAVTQTSLGWSLVKVTGNAASGYTVQVKTGGSELVTNTLIVTFNAGFSNSGNENLAVIAKNDNTATNPGTGFAELTDLTWTGPNSSLEVNNLVNNTSCDWTWTLNAKAGAIIVEVAVATAPSGCTGSKLALMGAGC